MRSPRAAAVGALAGGAVCMVADTARLALNDWRVRTILADRARQGQPSPAPTAMPEWWDLLWSRERLPISRLSDEDYLKRLRDQVDAVEAEIAFRDRRAAQPPKQS